LVNSGECDGEKASDVLVNCAASCGYQLQWNPFARIKLGINEAEFLSTNPEGGSEYHNGVRREMIEEIGQRALVDVGYVPHREAAVIMFESLTEAMGGEDTAPGGLRLQNAANEFTFTAGLANAFLYTFRSARLALLILQEVREEEETQKKLALAEEFGEESEEVREVDNALEGVVDQIQGHRTYLRNAEERILAFLRTRDAAGARQLFPYFLLDLMPTFEVVRWAGPGIHSYAARRMRPLPSVPESFPNAGDLASVKLHPTSLGSAEVHMPTVGFGTWMLSGQECYDAVLAALRAGYRHIDTAQAYGNEEQVGLAIADSGVPRSEIFLATKLSFEDDVRGGPERVRAVVEDQLSQLGTDYLDLYMFHGTFGMHEYVLEAWHVLEELHLEGKLRSLGLSNYSPTEVDQIREIARQARPTVLQNKFDLYHQGSQFTSQPEDVVEFCRQRNMVVVGYSSLSAWPLVVSPLHDPHVARLSYRYNKRPAQILLRWQLQLGVAAIPRSSDPGRVAENLDVFDFELLPEEVEELSALTWLMASDLHHPTGENIHNFEIAVLPE